MKLSFWGDKKVLVTGGAGFLGSHVVDALRKRGATNIVIPRSAVCDLRIRFNCLRSIQNIDLVIHLAARVGGIGFNIEHPGEMVFDNAIMGLQLMEEARLAGIKKFVTIGTVCCYPASPSVPFKEEDLWNGCPTEETGPYGHAKRLLLVQGQAYRKQYGFNSIFLMPTNLYGSKDDFNPESSHVIPALIKKFCDAGRDNKKQVIIWGTERATRDFLYVDDAAEGILLATERYDKPEPVNLGSGIEVSIKEVVEMIAALCDFTGQIVWDDSKPDGQPRRCLDISRAKREFDFNPKISLKEGLERTIEWYTK